MIPSAKRNFKSELSQRAVLGALMLLLAGGTVACNRVPNGVSTGNVTGQANTKVSLNVKFQLASPLPDYYAKTAKIQIKLISASSNTPVNDSFDVTLSSSTQTLERTLTDVPSGQVSAEVHLLDADGKDVVSPITSSFSLVKDNSAPLTVKLDAAPSLVAPVPSASNLDTLRQQRRDLLVQLQSDSTKENSIISQLAGLRLSPNPEDQTLRQQLQAELQVLQTQRQTRESQLEDLNAQLTRLEAQGASSGTGQVEDQVFTLRQQSTQLSAAIDTNLKQRSQLSLQIKSLVRGQDNDQLAQLQGELQTLDKQINDQITQLEQINTQLKALEAKLTSQVNSQPPEQLKPQLEAKLASLKTQIATLEIEIPELQQRIAVLVGATDMLSVQRRENLEAELKTKQDALASAKSDQASVQAQLDKLG